MFSFFLLSNNVYVGLLFWFFGDFRCDVLLLIISLDIYKNRKR